MILLHNTLTRKTEEFVPIKKGRVGMYTCGPTVYNYAHLGNLRSYVFEDILKRVLRFNEFKVKHVMNITDVGHLTSDADEGEDKMEKGSAREGKTAWEIAEFYTEAFKKDLAELNISEPDIFCKATDHIKEQIALVKKLEKKGFTYRTLDGVYFDTSKLEDYGKLAGLKNQELRAGARVDIGDKKNMTDFALWKFSPPLVRRQMEWESPWGKGFPGWHIECSAMSTKYLGQPFDIHCGGIDHIPVHHTNEIAQSEAAEGKPMANYWLHNEFINVGEGAKMAKSGDNFLTLAVLKEKNIDPLAYRYLLLQTHYRKQLAFSWNALGAAQTGLKNLYTTIAGLPKEKTPNNQGILEQFTAHINNDMDTPAALALIWTNIKDKRASQKLILELDEVLGLEIKNNLEKKPAEEMPEEVKIIARARDDARQNKDWAKSDELRKQLEDLGYTVEDNKDGTSSICSRDASR